MYYKYSQKIRNWYLDYADLAAELEILKKECKNEVLLSNLLDDINMDENIIKLLRNFLKVMKIND